MPARERTNDLREACKEVMEDRDVLDRYPTGMDAADILTEIRKKKGGNAFPLVSILDVIDEMVAAYGPGRPPRN